MPGKELAHGAGILRFSIVSFVGVIAMALSIGACSSDASTPASSEPTGSTQQPLWVNGDFEDSPGGAMSPVGWTVSTNLNPGITDTRPGAQTVASLNLAAGGAPMTYVLAGAPESQVDPDVGTAGTLRFPKYGQRAIRLNYTSAATPGKNKNVNSLKQSMTIGVGDVDPTDGKAHVRFAVAPVLENPGHTYVEQPYYYVRLHNLTTNTALYQDFNASGQPGVPWKTFTTPGGTSAGYTDWQLVDISPGDAAMAVGDQVELTVMAAGCSPGGHWGRLYVDAVGSGLPGLYTWATGPQKANAGSNVTYALNYKNGSTTATTGTVLKFTTPPSTTFRSVSLPGCTTPAVGTAGTVTCPLGTLSNGAVGSGTVTVAINGGTASGAIITNGNYAISATGTSGLVGPKVFTTVSSGQAYSDVAVTVDDGRSAVAWGQAVSYTVRLTNAGPIAASSVTVSDVMPAQLTGVTWTCAATGGATCTAAGSGDISDSIALPVGGTATYAIDATVVAGAGAAKIRHAVLASIGGATSDPDTTNNTAVDIDAVSDELRTMTVTKTGAAAAGTIVSTPAALQCGTGCVSASADFASNAQVQLTATPVSGATFAGWGGPCAGLSPTCTVTMTSALAVTARFVTAPTTIVTNAGDGQATRTSTAFPTALSVLVTDASGNGVPNRVVTFGAPGAGASAVLGAATATTDANGIATISASANATPGTYAVTATMAELPTPVTFNLVNVGPPAAMTVRSGDGQSTTVGTAFAARLEVLVEDSTGRALPGITVSFDPPPAGASAGTSSPSAVTDASGIASVAAAANGIAGAYAVTATAGATSASFSLTNTAGDLASLVVTGGDAQSTPVTTTFGAPLRVKALDANGNPVAGASVAFAAPLAGASALVTSTTTNAAGIATATATANTIAGGYTVVASSAGVQTPFALTNLAGAPAGIGVVGGSGQQATVATAFGAPLVAVVTDAFGNTVGGASVTFTAPGAGATAALAAPTVVTDTGGQATTLATASTVSGSYVITASVAGGATPASFALTNVAGAVASLAPVTGGGQTAQVRTAYATPLAVRARDAHGNPVAGASVAFAAPGAEPTASLSATTATTSASGDASVNATAGTTAGTFTVTASTPGATTVSFGLTSTPAAPASTTVDEGDAQTARVTTAYARPLSVVVRDVDGNPVPGATVTFVATASPATATLSAPSATTDATGKASVTATADTHAGAFTVQASAPGTTAARFQLVNRAGDATAITATAESAPQGAAAGSSFARPLGVIVVDAWSNPVPGAAVRFTVPATEPTATVSTADATTDASGHASVPAAAGHATGAYLVRATTTGVAAPASFALENLAGAPGSVAIAGGGGQTAAVDAYFTDALAVVVRDAHGNVVPGANVTFTPPAAAPTGAVDASSVTTDATGTASTRIKAGTRAGRFDVVASVGGAAAPVIFTLDVAAGAAATIAVEPGSSPQSARVGAGFPAALALTVVDRFGNPVPGAHVRFAAPAAAPTVTLDTTDATTDAAGRCAVPARAGTKTGDVVVRALVDSLTSTFQLTNLAGDPTVLERIAGSPQSAVVATAFAAPLAVVVRDAQGNPVPQVVVHFDAPTTGASAVFSADDVLTDAAGEAHVDVTAGTNAGSYVVTATAGGAAAPVTFALVNAVGAPTSVVADAVASPQSTKVTRAFAQPLGILVTDAHANPVTGVAVTWKVPADGASAALDSLRTTTDRAGRAHVTAIANAIAGSFRIEAGIAGAVATFELTNLVDGAATVALGAGTGQHALANDTFATPLAFHVADALGNGVAGTTINLAFAATGPTGAVVGGAVVTDAHGDASATISSGPVPGTFVVSATIEGGTAPALATMTVDAIPTTATLALAVRELTVDKAFVAEVRVASEHGTPSGAISLLLADGTVVGTGTLVDGAASVPVHMPRPGTYAVHAAYGAQGSFASSESDTVTVVAGADSGTLSGGSCAMGTRPAGPASSVAPLLLLAVVGWWRARRRRIATVAASALTLLPATAKAEGLSVQRFHAAAADSQWFMLDSASFDGHAAPTFAAVGDYAHRPLVAYQADGTRRAEVVRHSAMLHAGASIALFDRLRIALTVPFAVAQSGERSDFNGVALAPPSGPALGDVALAADVRLVGRPTAPLRVAVGARATLPTGARSQYVGDGVVGVEPRVAIAGTIADLEYATQASILLRPGTELAALPFRHELRVAAGVGMRFVDHRLLVGPEIIAAMPLASGTGTGNPVEAWLGAHFTLTRTLDLGAGAGIGIHNAVGSPDQRGLLSITWRPAGPPRHEVAVHLPAPAPAEAVAREEDPVAPAPEPEPVATSEAPAAEPAPASAPAPAPPARRTAPTIGKVLPDRIYFESDRYWVRENQEDKMRTIATYLRVHKDVTALVEGHADENGPNDHNGDLSVERAARVVQWLVYHGIDAKRLEARSYGAARPSHPGSTWGDHAHNRRVEIRVLTAAEREALDAAGQ